MFVCVRAGVREKESDKNENMNQGCYGWDGEMNVKDMS